jgi:hypothetical protein
MLVKVGVPALRIVKVGRPARGVATIAVAHSIDQVAAEPHQGPVFTSQIQVDGRYLEANLNLGLGIVIVRVSPRRLNRHGRKDDRNEHYDRS